MRGPNAKGWTSERLVCTKYYGNQGKNFHHVLGKQFYGRNKQEKTFKDSNTP